MSTRVLLQRHAPSLTASLLIASVALYPKVVLAESSESPESSRVSLKKPIYDDLDAVLTTATLPPAKATSPAAPNESANTNTIIPRATLAFQQQQVHRVAHHSPSPTDRLASHIRHARLALYTQACTAEDALNRTLTHAFHLERAFTNTLASLAPAPETGERLMPGVVYVLVATMAGSIVARRSNILLRAAVPTAFAVGMGCLVLPVTMRNVAALAWRYEQRLPVVAEGHLHTREAWEQTVRFVQMHRKVAADMVEEKVKGVREAVEDWVKKGR